MLPKIRIRSRKKIDEGIYKIRNKSLIKITDAEEAKKEDAFLFEPDDIISEEILEYYRHYCVIVNVLDSFEIQKQEIWISSLSLQNYSKELNFGDLNVDLSLLKDFLKKEITNNQKGFFFMQGLQQKDFEAKIPLSSFYYQLYFEDDLYKIEFRYNENKKLYEAQESKKIEILNSYKELRQKNREKNKIEQYHIRGEDSFLVKGKIIETKEEQNISSWQKKEIEQVNQEKNDNINSKYYDFWGRTLVMQKAFIVRDFIGFGLNGCKIEHKRKDILINGNWKEEQHPKNLDSIVLYENTDEGLNEMIQGIKNNEHFSTDITKIIENKEWIENSYNEILKLKQKGITLKVKQWQGDQVICEDVNSKKLDKYKYITLDIKSASAQMDRLDIAYRAFLNNNLPLVSINPLLIDDEMPTFSKKYFSHISTQTIKELFWDKENSKIANLPYKQQEKAISMALQTDDIAIIQGPPGTGKTTVSHSIASRLNEIYKNYIDFRILFTSYQHVAVDNLIEKVKLNGFPIIRYKNEENNEKLSSEMSDWRDSVVKLVGSEYFPHKEKNRNYSPLPASESQKGIIKLLDEGGSSFGIFEKENEEDLNYDTKPFTDKINKLTYVMYKDGFSKENIEKLNTATNDIKKLYSKNSTIEKLLDLIPQIDPKDTNIRTEIDTLQNSFFPQDKSNDKEDKAINKQDFFKEHMEKKIKLKLQKQKDFFELLKELFHKAEELNFSNFTLDDITQDYLYSLQKQDLRVKSGIAKWAVGYACSLQHIDRVEKQYDVGFHTIIVDEAGKADPLNLLISFEKAHRKVILLGDQKQLPHFIDQELENLIEQDKKNNDIESKFLKESFFGKIYKICEKKGKALMLDKQFRMHPKIGDVVSKAFYDDELRNGKSEGDFLKFDLFPNSIYWIDVPKGIAQRDESRSWYRTEEVKKIREVIEKLKSEEITIGVISPYNAQVKKIKENLKDLLPKQNIGTIDSFQGREFDILIFSVARSKDDKGKTYGNLESKHRMNVALSRAKSLLIIVGEEKLIKAKGSSNLKYLYPIYQKSLEVK